MMGGFGGCCETGWLGSFGSFGWIGLVLNLLILIAIAIGVVTVIMWLIRKLKANSPAVLFPAAAAHEQTSPREVLAIRYARGEIDGDEFKRMVSDLE